MKMLQSRRKTPRPMTTFQGTEGRIAETQAKSEQSLCT